MTTGQRVYYQAILTEYAFSRKSTLTKWGRQCFPMMAHEHVAHLSTQCITKVVCRDPDWMVGQALLLHLFHDLRETVGQVLVAEDELTWQHKAKLPLQELPQLWAVWLVDGDVSGKKGRAKFSTDHVLPIYRNIVKSCHAGVKFSVLP